MTLFWPLEMQHGAIPFFMALCQSVKVVEQGFVTSPDNQERVVAPTENCFRKMWLWMLFCVHLLASGNPAEPSAQFWM